MDVRDIKGYSSKCGKFGKVTWEGDEDDGQGKLSEDEFEMEMEAELQRRAQKAERDVGLHARGETNDRDPKEPNPGPSGESDKPERYDKIYFDSDEEEEGMSEDKLENRNVKSNDDLLYDPDMDKRDQEWIDGIRENYVTKAQRSLGKSKNSKKKKLPNSDAVLNCPGCFTLLCLDCQRHELYENQYRAMFVMNCTVNTQERLKFPLSKSKRKQRRNKSFKKNAEQKNDDQLENDDDDEVFNPVKCDHCSTEVAVFDKDEVYHFFNIVSSHT